MGAILSELRSGVNSKPMHRRTNLNCVYVEMWVSPVLRNQSPVDSEILPIPAKTITFWQTDVEEYRGGSRYSTVKYLRPPVVTPSTPSHSQRPRMQRRDQRGSPFSPTPPASLLHRLGRKPRTHPRTVLLVREQVPARDLCALVCLPWPKCHTIGKDLIHSSGHYESITDDFDNSMFVEQLANDLAVT